jgi:GNAT superfamily N-acetyltransferase
MDTTPSILCFYTVWSRESSAGAACLPCLFHRSTTRVEHTCYLQDLFTEEGARGRGLGRSLIEGVYEAARVAGIRRVYWQTHETNATGRLLYDKVARHVGFVVYAHDV